MKIAQYYVFKIHSAAYTFYKKIKYLNFKRKFQ